MAGAAARHGEVAIGYRLMREKNDPAKAYGIRVCPHKADKIHLQPEDRIIVLAQGS